MNTFSNEIGDIYRLKVPFDNIYTSVFFIKTDDKNILVDCATFKEDVDTCILPALQVLGYGISDIDILVLTVYHMLQ